MDKSSSCSSFIIIVAGTVLLMFCLKVVQLVVLCFGIRRESGIGFMQFRVIMDNDLMVVQDMGLSSVSIRTLLTVLNYRTSNDQIYVRFEINFLL